MSTTHTLKIDGFYGSKNKLEFNTDADLTCPKDAALCETGYFFLDLQPFYDILGATMTAGVLEKPEGNNERKQIYYI